MQPLMPYIRITQSNEVCTRVGPVICSYNEISIYFIHSQINRTSNENPIIRWGYTKFVLDSYIKGAKLFILHPYYYSLYLCRNCNNENEEETIEHLLCNFPDPKPLRSSFLGNRYFNNLTDLDNLTQL